MNLRRPHLNALLNGAERVVVLRAEGGAGKTLLVTDWLHSTGGGTPTIWITLDQNLRSAPAFWARLATMLISRGIVTLGGDVSEVAPSLIADQLATRPGPLLLVVDNLHFLDPDGHAELAQFVERVPSLRLIGMTRSATPLDSGVLATRVGTRVIDSSQLALSTDELMQLASREQYAFGPSVIATIKRITGGHILASRVALDVATKTSRNGSSASEEEHLTKAVAEALELKGLLPVPEQIDVAARLAIAPYVSRELAEQLTGQPAVWELVELLEAQSLGTLSTMNGHEIFTFHRVLKAALNARATWVISPENLRESYRIASAHMAEWGDPVEAIRLILRAGDYDDAWPIFIRHFSPLSLALRDELLPVLEELPDEILARHGLLALIIAILISERSPYVSTRSLQLVSWALRTLDEMTEPSLDAPAKRLLYLVARVAAYRSARQYTLAAEYCDQAVETVERLWHLDREAARAFSFQMTIQLLLTYILNGQFATALEAARRSGQSPDAHLSRRNHRTALISYALAMRGEMIEAREVADLLPIAEMMPSWRRWLPGIGWNIAMALSHVESGEIDATDEALDSLLSRAHFSEHWAAIYYVYGFTRLIGEDPASGYAELATALDAAAGRSTSEAIWARLSSIFADLAVATGDITAAERIIGTTPNGLFRDLSRARIALVRGEYEMALALASSAVQAEPAPRELVTSWLTIAVAGRRLGLTDAVETAVSNAVAHLRRFGLTSPLAFIPRNEIDDLLEERGVPVPDHIGDPFGAVAGEALSSRERVVLQLLQTSATASEIARQLFVSPNTIKTQLRSIYRKLGVSRRAEAIEAAQRRGLL